jgi:hypothetical protein
VTPASRPPASIISHFDPALPVLSSPGGSTGGRPVGSGYSISTAALEEASEHLDAANLQAESAARTIGAAPSQFRSLGPGFNTAVRKAQSTATDALRAFSGVISTTRSTLDQTLRRYASTSELNAGTLGHPTLPSGGSASGSS